MNQGFQGGTGSGTYTLASCSGLAGFGAAQCSTITCGCNVTLTFNGQVFTATSNGKEVLVSNTTQLPWNCGTVADPQYLSSIAVSPSTASAAVGATQQFTALGTYADGSTKTLTTALWTSSSLGVATIRGGSGLATGIAVGTTTITASSSGRSGAATLTVTGGGESGGGGGGNNGGGGSNCGGTSPILIDTTGAGFQLTSASDGVIFDITGDGKPIKLS